MTADQLWWIVLAAITLDVASTVAGLSLGLVELNPIAVFGMDAIGLVSLAVLKIPALAMGIVGWRRLPDPYRQLNLLGLAMPWLAAVVTNCGLILNTL